MSIFDRFRKAKSGSDIESVIIGFLRKDAGDRLEMDPSSAEFDKKCNLLSEDIEKFVVPNLDREIEKQVYGTLSRTCPNRFDEAYGTYLIALCTRVMAIQLAIMAGKVSREEATIDVLQKALLNQLKNVVKQCS